MAGRGSQCSAERERQQGGSAVLPCLSYCMLQHTVKRCRLCACLASRTDEKGARRNLLHRTSSSGGRRLPVWPPIGPWLGGASGLPIPDRDRCLLLCQKRLTHLPPAARPLRSRTPVRSVTGATNTAALPAPTMAASAGLVDMAFASSLPKVEVPHCPQSELGQRTHRLPSRGSC